jgi:hypothetical protein
MMAVVSHDAGGAEVVSSYVRRHAPKCQFCLAGPALGVFQRKLGDIRTVELESALRGASSLLCGTSWQSELEWRALRLARASGVRSVAFLDHWVNYAERFERHGQVCLPDEIWVADADAEHLARGRFGALPLRRMPNLYVEECVAEIEGLRIGAPAVSAPTALYLCEPVREHARVQYGDERFFGYVEEEALDFFFDKLPLVVPGINRVVIRPHPSESPGKYDWAVRRSALEVSISSGRTLAQDIADAVVIAGCESMAMVVALHAGKRVLSSIPPNGRPCVLPHSGIETISHLVGAHLKGTTL